jgi:hypothetical protein
MIFILAGYALRWGCKELRCTERDNGQTLEEKFWAAPLFITVKNSKRVTVLST